MLCANQGETVDINLTNQLAGCHLDPVPRAGRRDIAGRQLRSVRSPTATGDLSSLVPEAPPGGSVTYSFTATTAGTYLYESGSDPQLQVQMGLFGAIVVRPAGITITAPTSWPSRTKMARTGSDQRRRAGMTLAEADSGCAAHAACAYASLDRRPSKCDPLAIYDSAVPGAARTS